MSGREWPLGTVAMVTWNFQGEPRTDLRFRYQRKTIGEVWESPEGTWIGDHTAKDARPLVVIDPEDREDLGRLLSSLQRMSFSAHACGAFTCLQAALREFANPTPPKPPEPSGLGAVVEDAEGREWLLRIRHETRTTKRPWIHYDAETFTSTSAAYDEIDAVRVLSEGVS